jgi:hypothetical protein
MQYISISTASRWQDGSWKPDGLSQCSVRIASIGNRAEVWLETVKMTYNRLAVANGRIVTEKQTISVPTEKGEPMDKELIYREDLLAEYDRVIHLVPHSARRLMENAPAVNAREVINASWILQKDGSAACTNCNRLVNSFGAYDSWFEICPHCGAVMKTAKEISISTVDQEIIMELAKNGLKVSKTASALFMHQNTVRYHIGKIKQNTGLEATDFYGMCKLLRLVEGGRANG